MKNAILSGVILLSFLNILEARIPTDEPKNPIISSIKVGWNYSSLINTKGAVYDVGFRVGIGKEFTILPGFVLEPGIYYSSIKGGLRNVPIEIDMAGQLPVDIYTYDVNFSEAFIEIPILIKVTTFKNIEKKFKIRISAGSSLNITYYINRRLPFPTYGNVSLKRKKFLFTYDPEPHEVRKFKYEYSTDKSLSHNWLNYNIGFDVIWSKFFIEILYSRTHQKLDCISYLCGLDKVHTFSLLLGINFEGF